MTIVGKEVCLQQLALEMHFGCNVLNHGAWFLSLYQASEMNLVAGQYWNESPLSEVRKARGFLSGKSGHALESIPRCG